VPQQLACLHVYVARFSTADRDQPVA